MLTQPKISPIFQRTITLSSLINHQDFLRKNTKFASHLYLNSILEDQPDRSQPNVKEVRNLTKIFRNFKVIKKIHQNDLALHRIRLPPSKAKYLVKRIQRVEILGLQDKQNRTKFYPARLDLWLKYGKWLQNINYQSTQQMPAVVPPIHNSDRVMQKCLKFLPQHRDLTIFKLRLPQISSETMESLLEFQRYPKTIKTFAIYQQKAEGPKRVDSDKVAAGFSRLKFLKSLTISGVNLPHVITDILLEKAPSLLNIKKFNIQNVEILPFGYVFDLKKCQTFQNLRHLKIGKINERSSLSLTNPPMLESLDIAAELGADGIVLISQFVSLFNKSLKSLKMDLRYPYDDTIEWKFKDLFCAVSELEMLTSFKFKVQNTDLPFGFKMTTLFRDILQNLKGLFLKNVKLESFEWEVPRVSAPEVLLDLLKLLEGSQKTLRKLKISPHVIKLEKSQETWILNFLRKLEKIEVLYLAGFLIKENSFWASLVDCLLGIKSLKSLGVGFMQKDWTQEWFTCPLSKIAQKKGLETLKVVPLYFGAAVGIDKSPLLSLKNIMRANPALKEVSQNVRKLLNASGLE